MSPSEQAQQFVQQQLDDGVVVWTNKSELLEKPALCIDGRWVADDCHDGIPAMLGGSSGEAFRQIAAFLALLELAPEDEQVAAQRIREHMDQIVAYFQDQAPLCLHSDEHAHGDTPGCGYFRLMRENPEGIRFQHRALVDALIATFEEQCRPQQDDATTLPGEHQEEGALILHFSGNSVGRVIPNYKGRQYFIAVPEFESRLRLATAYGHLALLERLTGHSVDPKRFVAYLDDIAQGHLLYAVAKLNHERPPVEVWVDSETRQVTRVR